MSRPSSTRTVLGLTAALVAGTIALAAPATAATDTTKPVVSGGVTFAPSTVDVTSGDADTTLSVQLTDDSSGVVDASVRLVAPGGAYTADVELTRTAGTATDGTWSGPQSFSATFDTPGKWTAGTVFATDAAGNTAEVSGPGGSVTVTRTADTVAPVLVGVTADTLTADTTTGPTDVVVRVRASDDLSGVESGTVTFANKVGETVDGALSGAPVAGSARDGGWDVPVTFPARSTAGVWRLSGITLADGQYNVADYDDEDAELPSLAVRVTTTDDTTAPTLSSFSIGPDKISTAYNRTGLVYARVAFTDTVSGLDSAEVTLQRPNTADGKPGPIDFAEAEPVSFDTADIRTGTSRNGTLTIPIFVDGFTAGAWKVYSIVLLDVAGNPLTVLNAQLGAKAGFTVSTAAADTASPTSSGYAFSPDTLDTRTAPQIGSVLIAAADPDSVPAGITRGEATLTSPSGAQTAVATFLTDNDLAAGDPANGTFRAGFSLPVNAEDGAWRVSSLKLTDGAQHTATIAPAASAPTLTVLGAGRAPATVPGAPTISSATVTNTTATLAWTAPGDDGGARIGGYSVAAYRGGAPAGTFDATGTSLSVPNLVRGQSYTFTVAARNSAGTGPASAASYAVTVPVAAPGAPVIGSATLDETSATVTWTAPADNGGAAVTGYLVTPFLDTANGSVKQPGVRVGDTGTTTIDDLARGRTYTFRVAATNSMGDGAQSQLSNPVSVAATVPAAPRVAATRVAGSSATVSWQAPADGGAPITGYRVTGTPGGSCRTSGTSCVVPGLTPDTAYSFTVAAINEMGSSPESESSPTVVADRPGPTTLAVTGAPAKVVAGTAVTVTGRLTVTGTTTGAPAQRVRLQYRSGISAQTAWTTWTGTATTASDGSVRIAGFRPVRTVQVRLVSTVSDVHAAATSAARTVAVTRVLTLGSSSVKVKRGKTMTLTGRATPVRPGGVVTLQRSTGGRWQTIATKRVDGSTYSFGVRSTKRGSYSYRVITVGDATFATSVSNTRTLRVR